MPIYSFENVNTGEQFEKIMSYDEKIKYLEENSDIISILTKPLMIGYTIHRNRPDDGFRDRLREIKKSHRGSTINIK